MQPLTLP